MPILRKPVDNPMLNFDNWGNEPIFVQVFIKSLRTGRISPFFIFWYMLSAEQVEEKIRSIIGEINPEVFVVEYKLNVGKQSSLVLLIDTMDGIIIDDVARISRGISRWLDEAEPFSFPFNLEVSSPGVGKPFKVFQQYQQNIGRTLRIVDVEGKVLKGKLMAADEQAITLEPPKPKKKKKGEEEISEITIEMKNIKEAKVEISFN